MLSCHVAMMGYYNFHRGTRLITLSGFVGSTYNVSHGFNGLNIPHGAYNGVQPLELVAALGIL